MKCTKAQELFSSYLEETIEPPVRVVLEQHFDECTECKEQYEAFRASLMLLDELPEITPPPSFHAAVMARVEQARRAKPHTVRWWAIDWRGMFERKVPVRAVAMAAAVLLLVAIIVQLSPAGAIIAGMFGSRSGVCPPAGIESQDPVAPKPWTAEPRMQAAHLREGSGLTIGVTVDAKSDQHVVYQLRFTTRSDEEIAVEAYVLSKSGIDGSATRIVSGSVSTEAAKAVPVVVSRGGQGGPVLVRVAWDYDSRRQTEYVFLPMSFGTDAVKPSDSLRISAGTLRDSLGAVSAAYGIVVMSSADVSGNSSTVQVESGSPDAALLQAIRGTGLEARALASSVYAIEPQQ